MFPNAMLENPKTWNTILDTMIKVRELTVGKPLVFPLPSKTTIHNLVKDKL